MLPLEPLLDRRPAELSGGQRQRVAIGRAIVRDAEAVPVRRAAVQPRRRAARQHAASRSRSCTASSTATMIYVTHDQVEAMTLADRIVVLNAGRIEQVGAPMELYNDAGQPLRRRLHRLAADELPRRPHRLGAAGQDPRRPPRASRDQPRGRREWPGTISHVEHLGADTNVYVRTEPHGLFTVRRFGEHRYAVDETVHLTPNRRAPSTSTPKAAGWPPRTFDLG